MRLSSTARYSFLGALAALAISLGLPIVRACADGVPPSWVYGRADLCANRATYAYVTLSFLTALISLGVLLGNWSRRANLVAATDSLTGLLNRRSFAAHLSTNMRRDRRAGRPTTVMCLDLDHLKSINDSKGHQAGDAALVAVARALSSNVRVGDILARFGGDEFAVLLPGTAATEAAAVGERILTELARRGLPSHQNLGVSIGIAELSATATPDQLLVAADAALYWSKRAGGRRVSIAPPEILPNADPACGLSELPVTRP